LNAARALINKIEARNVRGNATLKGGVFTLKNFDLDAFGGAIGLAGTTSYKDPAAPTFDLDLDLKKVKVAQLLSQAAGLNAFGAMAGYLSGDLSTKTKFQGELTDKLSLNLEKLASKGTLNIDGAKLSGHPLQQGLSSFLQAPQLASLDFKSWLQPFEIKAGKLDVKNMKLAAGDFALTANGQQSVDGKLQMGLDLKLPEKMSAGLRQKLPASVAGVLFGDPGKPIEVPLALSGTLTSPRFSLNEAALSQIDEKRVKAKLAGAQDKLAGQAIGKVDQLLSKPKPAAKGTTTAKQPAAKKPSGSVQDQLKSLLK
jgi:hypothetical protein